MKKTNIILILIAMLSLLTLGAVVVLFGDTDKVPGNSAGVLEEFKDNYNGEENADKNKEIVVRVLEDFSKAGEKGIYDLAFQNSVRGDIDKLISENTYTEDNPLVIYNPFLTNSQSLYVYFETEEAYAVSYSVHTPEADYKDFGGNVVPHRPDTSKVHEFQVIGLIPNAISPLIVQVAMVIASAGLTASALSFLGFGVVAPTPEWGAMLSTARAYIRHYPHMVFFPGLFIMLTCLSLNLVGDAIRDALDPKLKN